jgi:hypothetical protein
MTDTEWLEDRAALQHIHDFLMFNVRPVLGSPYSPPEAVFPPEVHAAMIRILERFQLTTFGQRMTGKVKDPDGTVRDAS